MNLWLIFFNEFVLISDSRRDNSLCRSWYLQWSFWHRQVSYLEVLLPPFCVETNPRLLSNHVLLPSYGVQYHHCQHYSHLQGVQDSNRRACGVWDHRWSDPVELCSSSSPVKAATKEGSPPDLFNWRLCEPGVTWNVLLLTKNRPSEWVSMGSSCVYDGIYHLLHGWLWCNSMDCHSRAASFLGQRENIPIHRCFLLDL